MRSGGTSLFGEEKQSEDEFVTVPKEYLMELEKKARNFEYLRGRVEGMECVIYSNAFKDRSE